MMDWKSFKKAGHPLTLFAAFLHFDICFMVWVLIGALGVFISQDFHLTPAQKGLLTAIPLLGGALTRIPVGFLADRLGTKRVGLALLGVVCIPLVWGWLAAGSYPQMLALGLLLGVAGSSFAVALPMASRWYPPEHQGLAMGIAGAGNSGTVLATLFAPRLAKAYGWHSVFAVALGVVFVTTGLFALLSKEPPRAGKRQSVAEMFSVFKQLDCLWFCIVYSVTFGGFVGFASFLSIFFFDQYGISKIAAGNFTALCVFSGSFFRPVGGYLSDRWGGDRVLRGLMVSLLMCLGFLGFLPPLPVAATLFFLLMGSLGMGNGSVFQLVPQRFAKEIGLMTGIVGAAGGLGGFFLPTLLGAIKGKTGSFGPAFWILCLFVIAAFAALFQVKRGIKQYRLRNVLPQGPLELVPVREESVPC